MQRSNSMGRQQGTKVSPPVPTMLRRILSSKGQQLRQRRADSVPLVAQECSPHSPPPSPSQSQSLSPPPSPLPTSAARGTSGGESDSNIRRPTSFVNRTRLLGSPRQRNNDRNRQRRQRRQERIQARASSTVTQQHEQLQPQQQPQQEQSQCQLQQNEGEEEQQLYRRQSQTNLRHRGRHQQVVPEEIMSMNQTQHTERSCSSFDDDTIGSLTAQPTTMQRLASVGGRTREDGFLTGTRGDHPPPQSTPGAFYQRFRAVGDVPEWATRITGFGTSRRSDTTTRETTTTTTTTTTGATTETTQQQQQQHHQQNRQQIFLGMPSHGTSLTQDDPSDRRASNSSAGYSTTSGSDAIRAGFRSFLRRVSTRVLVHATPVDAETVVYAEVTTNNNEVDNGNDDKVPIETEVGGMELILYTLAVLIVGIFIGRYTHPSNISSAIECDI